MKDMMDIYKRWDDMWFYKEEYAFGGKDINLDKFKLLVKDTYYMIREMQEHIGNNDYAEVNTHEMRIYMHIISIISMYSASCCTDNSKEHSFAITRLLAFDLANFGASYDYWVEEGEEPWQEGVITSDEAFNYGFDKILHYDVNKGDLSDYVELADRARC